MVKMYTVAEKENNIIILENLETGKTINIDSSLLDRSAKEGDVVKYSKGIYVLDKEETINRVKKIKEKMDRLRS